MGQRRVSKANALVAGRDGSHERGVPGSAEEVVYNAESRVRRPRELLAVLCRDLVASRELAWRFMVRDLRAQYRQAALGVVWAFVPPLLLAVGATLASRAQVINVGATDLPYPAYVMFSTALWQTFVEALHGPSQAVASAKAMLARIAFPREAIVLAKVGEVLVNFGAKLLLIAALFLWFGIPVSWTALLAPVAVLELVLLGTWLGVLVAPFAVLYQDVSRALMLATGFWLFLTPVVYPMPGAGAFGTVVRLNPVTPVLVTARELATTGAVSDPWGFTAVCVATLVGLLVTWVVFRLAMPFAIERAGS